MSASEDNSTSFSLSRRSNAHKFTVSKNGLLIHKLPLHGSWFVENNGRRERDRISDSFLFGRNKLTTLPVYLSLAALNSFESGSSGVIHFKNC
ncbi:hypothetical protein NPIL_42091 [Nephila pilipes]|uniref:Uncharacterized protein n=1 Tax=Nephila pilipes TaxID=299642 RepID=A0A8X6U239_NEPPI|nr:hypothetical protein NPIL_196811 [Nephila pilipes]GFT70566.1 hypothetical protein NPIL_42091 [Nephila pilipes]